MNFRTIKLPKSERFVCPARELKSVFSDVENLSIYCGVLGKTFAFDGRSKNRPRLEGRVVAQAQVSRDLEAIVILYAIKKGDYPERAATEFRDSIIHEVHDWLKDQISKPETAILGVETLLIEWTGREHKKHLSRFL